MSSKKTSKRKGAARATSARRPLTKLEPKAISASIDEQAFVLVPVRVKIDAVAVVLSDGTGYEVRFAFERFGQSEKVDGTVGFIFPGRGQLVPDELLGYLKKDKQVQLVASLGKDQKSPSETKLIARYVRIQQTDFALNPTIDVLPVPKNP